MDGIKAVILDLDQTITSDTGSWPQFTELIGGDLDKHLKLYESFKKGEITYKEAKKQLIDLWKEVNGLSKTEIEQVFGKVTIRPGAEEAVKYLNQNYKVCIISGAIDVFVELISKRLGINDHYAATKFIFDEKDILIDFDYKLSRGEEKVGFLHKFCDKYELNPKDCSAIGDGESDMPIFNKVALPILYVAKETTDEQKLAITKHLNTWQDIYKYL